jgi:serine/threonine-protein kinase
MNKSKILYSLFFIFLFGITTITVLIISNSENNSAYSQRVLQTYENDKYGIKLQYPANWDYREYKNFVFETGEAVVELHPFEKIDPHIALSVSFLSPENATLESFTEQNLKSIQKPVLTDEVIKILNQNSSVTLGGLPAHKVVYESTFTDIIDKKPVIEKRIEMWTVLETEAYVLTFVGDREEYDQYIKTAEKIIDSFEFTR